MCSARWKGLEAFEIGNGLWEEKRLREGGKKHLEDEHHRRQVSKIMFDAFSACWTFQLQEFFVGLGRFGVTSKLS